MFWDLSDFVAPVPPEKLRSCEANGLMRVISSFDKISDRSLEVLLVPYFRCIFFSSAFKALNKRKNLFS